MRNHLLRPVLGLLLGAGTGAASAQLAPAPTPFAAYRATERQVNDLVHTKLDVSFDYARRYLHGAARLTLRPHAYATDSLRLDAKGMTIKSVGLVQGGRETPLTYEYADQLNLRIRLGRRFQPGESYTVAIAYTARPDERKAQVSAAIGEAKGLFFINPDSAVAGKPVQIWTQGETEAASVWFPTIDRPNQKTTSEIALTVPAKYVTLSNGALVSQKPAGPGLRTDTWKMEQPHAPYLFMLAVGDFNITKDSWRGKEVSYYLEPKYAGQARAIFGKTPRMLEFFSQRLGVEYPWNKYSQVVVRDYVAGAMENTTASLFGEQAQGTARELLDWDYAGVEREIAHELFHHWFGDYVTAESWPNLTVNESFANFSEVLWAEHEYGPDAGAAQADRSRQTYLRDPANYALPLLRFEYASQEEMFDAVTYQKGGSILNMLRSYLGEKVFFSGLQKYLKDNALGTGEAQQLRLALEAVSGQDLNWFFNQWYYRAGHPVVTIDYAYDAARRRQAVIVRQTQAGAPFALPLQVDLYEAGGRAPRRYAATLRHAADTLYFPAPTRPALVNVDADKVLLWLKTDRKPLAQFAYQQRHAPHYLDRLEALQAAQAQPADPLARQLLLASLSDKSPVLRRLAAEKLDLQNPALRQAAAPVLARLAAADPALPVRAAALGALAPLADTRYASLFTRALASPSYRVQGTALRGLLPLDPAQALTRATAFEADHKGALTVALTDVYGRAGGAAQWPLVLAHFDVAGPQDRFDMLPGLAALLTRLAEPAAWPQGIARIQELAVRYKPYGVAPGLIGLLRQLQQSQASRPTAAQVNKLVEAAVREIEAAK